MAEITQVPQQHKSDEVQEHGPVFVPRVDICDTGSELVMFADLPGVRPQDVDLRFENGELTLKGKVQPRYQGKAMYRQEYQTGDFQRTFELHESIDSRKISAECKNGVLKVHLPKTAAFQPVQIKVQG
jgi:HSP20 family protein